ncbi:MAG: rhodanese-like domain-containing protein [Verrucomicrobiota bacterium]
MIAPPETIGPQTTLQRVLEVFPGAQRALFRRYHIGGCSSCGFQPGETLEDLCRRNNDLPVAEVIAHIQSSHEQDLQMQVAPLELSQWLARGEPLRLLDIRTREEWEAARIEGSILLSQDLLQDMLAKWPRNALIVICDHLGKQCMDAAAYFLGHGFENVRALRGGIDAWSQEVDSKIPRYRLE